MANPTLFADTTTFIDADAVLPVAAAPQPRVLLLSSHVAGRDVLALAAKDDVLVVDYDLLAHMPQKVLPLLYQFLGEPAFEHDFSNVQYDAPEFDAPLGIHGLHKVRPQVKLEPRATLLPPDLFEQYSKLSFWQDQSNSRSHVITAHFLSTSTIEGQP